MSNLLIVLIIVAGTIGFVLFILTLLIPVYISQINNNVRAITAKMDKLIKISDYQARALEEITKNMEE